MNILSFQRPAIASFACLIALLFAGSVYAAVGEKKPPPQEKREALELNTAIPLRALDGVDMPRAEAAEKAVAGLIAILRPQPHALGHRDDGRMRRQLVGICLC